MDNRGSSVFAPVRGGKDSSGLGEFALACCAMLVLFCAVAPAQTATGQFSGHVYDPSGAAVAGSTVKVQDPASGWTRTVQSNGEGLFELPLIPPGSYQITVTQAGFQSAVSPVLQLDVNPDFYPGLPPAGGNANADRHCQCVCRVAPGLFDRAGHRCATAHGQ